MKGEWQTVLPSQAVINAEGKIASPVFIFTVLPSLGTVFHFNANRILEEIPKDEHWGASDMKS